MSVKSLSLRLLSQLRLKSCGDCRQLSSQPAAQHASQPSAADAPSKETSDSATACARKSPLGIQLLSPSLHAQLFPANEANQTRSQTPLENEDSTLLKPDDKASLQAPQSTFNSAQSSHEAKAHLASHGLWGRTTSTFPDVEFQLPPLRGASLDEHFRRIAEDQIRPFKDALEAISDCELPPRPGKWTYSPGWTKYPSFESPASTEPFPVEYPDGNGLVFDVETLVREGNIPTIAVAVSDANWFSWCSDKLFEDGGSSSVEGELENRILNLNELIPLEHPNESSRRPKIVVGHNVAFDRSYVREQYAIDPSDSQLRFVDTMSFHTAVAGFTSEQRTLYKAAKYGKSPPAQPKFGRKLPILDWMGESTTNSLKDLYAFYCDGYLNKDERDVFVKGRMEDVRNDFNSLMDYCATDVFATHQVLTHLTPMFFSRFPHPVSFGGTLEMGRCFLPVDDTWTQYMQNCDEAYKDLETEQRKIIKRLAASACRQSEERQFADDPWLWSLDWETPPVKIRKETKDLKEWKKKKKDKSKKKPPINSEKEINELCAKYGFSEEDTRIVLRVLEAPNFDSFCCLETLKNELLAMLCRLKRLPVSGNKAARIRSLRTCPSNPPETADIPESFEKKLPIEEEYESLLESLKSEFPDRSKEEIEAEARERLSEPLPNRLVKSVLRTHDRLYKVGQSQLSGYPNWYCEKCAPWKPGKDGSPPSDFAFGPNITTRQNLAPLMLKMSWKEFPMYFMANHGWGYLVPDANNASSTLVRNIRAVTEDAMNKELDVLGFSLPEHDDAWADIEKRLMTGEDFDDVWEAVKQLRSETKTAEDLLQDRVDTVESFPAPGLEGVRFYKIPRSTKSKGNVGNVLGKDFMKYMRDGTMQPTGPEDSKRALDISRMMTMWIGFRKRVNSQLIVKLNPAQRQNVILPRVITAGTITRRAVEKTWLTAPNPKSNSIGSELKSMVRAPSGWSFVGADVDSQEYWIASLLGDAHFGRQHGSTALGWMLIQGNREQGTDLHSQTAKKAGCTRDEAKTLNYMRIYGSGLKLAKNLLMEFNPKLTPLQAGANADNMFRETKGLRRPVASQDEDDDFIALGLKKKERKQEWFGGTESHMFNKLEEIAKASEPRTPILGARISKAVEPVVVGEEFLPSRVNWVVQSSAVDYLHLLLVGTRYLFDAYGIRGRFSLSIHDEVRYLVDSKHKYRATLALQIVNLWTRAMFSSRLGIDDLPLAVAFFSSVEVDSVMRKDVNQDAVTPSNPAGLAKEFGIGPGEALNIYQVLEITKGRLEAQDGLDGEEQ